MLERLGKDKRSSLFGLVIREEEPSLIRLDTKVNVIKLFLSVIYGISCKARVFVTLGWKNLQRQTL
jgi:hypothetical protein